MAVAFPDVRIGQPIRHGNLSVFSLFAEPAGEVEYVLSDEAIREGSVTVEEISESGSVPELLVENQGDVRVLFLEGEESRAESKTGDHASALTLGGVLVHGSLVAAQQG